MTLPAAQSRLGLLTDLYELTMAAGYFALGMAEREAVFHLFFRRHPFGGGYTVACGLAQTLDFLRRFRFGEEDLAYLAEQTGNDGGPLFSGEFLDHLGELRFSCDLDAVPEGTVVFPNQPLLRVRGPLLQAQILETALLVINNFETLIATKAARVCHAAEGDRVIEFGLRRAQGIDGGVTASRAAVAGGCDGTSNVLAGQLYDVPIMGTHAHSWVMSFPSEEEAFAGWARAQPNNAVFLVDTYDSLAGIDNAIRAAKRLRERGHEMSGIRLDSGDLAALSIEARRRLDAAGFEKASIIASSDLDEYEIARLKASGARVDVWGVGTRLATAFDQPALGGVYKLAAHAGGDPSLDNGWIRVLKLSEEEIKTTNPGIQQVRRFSGPEGFQLDVLFDEASGCAETWVDVEGREHSLPEDATSEDLLVPVARRGTIVYDPPATMEARQRTRSQLAALPAAVRRLEDPGVYPAGLDKHLHDIKMHLMEQKS